VKRILTLVILVTLALHAGAKRHQLRRGGQLLAYDLRFDPSRITEDMPEGLKELLRAYQSRPRYANRQQGRAVEPLLQSVRHQSDPFNRSCPYYIDDEGEVSQERCISGCVATCIEQVLTYYRYPEALIDTLHGWSTDHYTIPDVMPGTPIDWDNILYDYRQGYTDEQAQAVSDLTYYCGVAVHMNWGLSSSSASLGRGFDPLWRAFDYKTIAFISRAMYSTTRWNAMLRNELEQGRPVCYTGHNIALSGHAFNIDGVDEEGYYHVNWGYGGDYDGYFDLDYLNPFEKYSDATDLGQNEGLFSNQTAMFMHPEDFVIDVYDTLRSEDAFAGVRVDNITFRRQPDTQGFVVADFAMTNITNDSLNFTFEVLTYLPTDTAIFQQADYVALSAVNLAPGESRTWPVYCQFVETGERILSFSADDETLPYQMPVNIIPGTSPVLQFGDIEYRLIRYGDNLVAEFSHDVSNNASAGYSGNLITYCLFPEDSEIDERHWRILSLAAGTTEREIVRFQHLNDGQRYTLKIRCPWEVQREVSFVARFDDAVDGIGEVNSGETDRLRDRASAVYDLSGRQMVNGNYPSSSVRPKGIYVKHGKKILIP